MNQIKTVFAFTFRDAAGKKAFKITTLIMLALVLAVCVIVSAVGDNEEDTEVPAADDSLPSYKCIYIDDDMLIPGVIEAAKAVYTNTEFFSGNDASIAEYRKEIEENPDTFCVNIKNVDNIPAVSVIVNGITSSPPYSGIVDIADRLHKTNLLAQYGVEAEQIAVIMTDLAVSFDYTSITISGYVIGLVLVFIMFFAIYYYGYSVANSVANEKATRVMETLVVSAKPSRILLGKCLAMCALGLSQLTLLLVFSMLCIKFIIPGGIMIGGMPLTFEAFTPTTISIILIYFILGFALYALLYAMCGASVSKLEDLSASMMPVILLTLVAFYFAYMVVLMGNSQGLLYKLAVYLPFTSPFAIPYALLNSDIALADIAISAVILALTAVAAAFVCVRIYTASVLHYGKRLKLSTAFKSSK